MLNAILLSLAGLVGLAIGGELLVRGAVGIAQKLGVSTLFTGLVIVGFATSMPEMVASVQASLAGSPQIAWGNIVGSNLANTLLILGVSALVMAIALAHRKRVLFQNSFGLGGTFGFDQGVVAALRMQLI